MSDVDWTALQIEYVTSNISLRSLGDKHNIPLRTLAVHSAEDEWVEKRQQYRDKLATRTQEKALEDEANSLAKERERLVGILNTVIGMGVAQLIGKKKQVLQADGSVKEEWEIPPGTKVNATALIDALKLKMVLIGETVGRAESIIKDERDVDSAIEQQIQRLVERRMAQPLPSGEARSSEDTD